MIKSRKKQKMTKTNKHSACFWASFFGTETRYQNQFDTGFEPMTFRSPYDRSTMKVTTDRNDF